MEYFICAEFGLFLVTHSSCHCRSFFIFIEVILLIAAQVVYLLSLLVGHSSCPYFILVIFFIAPVIILSIVVCISSRWFRCELQKSVGNIVPTTVHCCRNLKHGCDVSCEPIVIDKNAGKQKSETFLIQIMWIAERESGAILSYGFIYIIINKGKS